MGKREKERKKRPFPLLYFWLRNLISTPSTPLFPYSPCGCDGLRSYWYTLSFPLDSYFLYLSLRRIWNVDLFIGNRGLSTLKMSSGASAPPNSSIRKRTFDEANNSEERQSEISNNDNRNVVRRLAQSSSDQGRVSHMADSSLARSLSKYTTRELKSIYVDQLSSCSRLSKKAIISKLVRLQVCLPLENVLLKPANTVCCFDFEIIPEQNLTDSDLCFFLCVISIIIVCHVFFGICLKSDACISETRPLTWL